MKLNTYIVKILILAISLAMPALAYTQERKEKAVNKQTVVTQKKKKAKQSATSPNKIQQTKNKKQSQTEEEIRAARKAERRAKRAEAERATRKGEKKSTDKNKKAAISKNKRDAAKGKKRPAAAPNKKRNGKSAPTASKRRFIALKTNVPFDALVVQNLALEVEVHKQVTIDFPVMWSISDIEREHGLRTIAFQPEGRWWLKSAQEGGHFFGLHAHAAWFNLKWEDNRYQTEKRPLLGAGISYGYRLPLGKHWGAEFNLGFGYANMKYNTYYNIENGARIDSRLRNYWGITRAGLSLVYRF